MTPAATYYVYVVIDRRTEPPTLLHVVERGTRKDARAWIDARDDQEAQRHMRVRRSRLTLL